MLGQFQELWRFRTFISHSIYTNIRNRFIRSKLGGAWLLLNPLAMVAVYALVLSKVLAAKLASIDHEYAYALYLMAGILGWTLFTETLTRSLSIFIDHANLIKKTAFPRLSLVLILVGEMLINHILLLVAILSIFLLLGFMPGLQIVWIPLLSLVTLLFALGLGMILGILNVFIRDIAQIVAIILQFAFWLTPIVYSEHIIPEQYRYLLNFNPVYPMINGFQKTLVYNTCPDTSSLAWIFLLSLVLLVFAYTLYRKSSADMVDAL